MDQIRLPRSHSHKAKAHRHHRLTESEIKKIIREMHLKVTYQRQAILEILAQGRQHFTAQEVFEQVHRGFPEIGFATVYRFLRKLTEFKFVSEVRMGGLPARYELAPTRHHDHMSCIDCGKIVEFENYSIENLQEKVAEELGFELTGHVLELYGRCSDCQKKDHEAERP
jgi:Fur family ferric uptake transcriptional regulator